MVKAMSISLFTAEERQRLDAAIAAAEKNTSGEIVPVVARSTGRYDRAEDSFGLALGLVAIAVWWFARGWLYADHWETPPLELPGLFALMASLCAGYGLGTALATRWPRLARPLIRQREMQDEVECRAAELFQRQRMHATRSATGVLIYVSLYERMVRVVGDDAITARLGQDDWNAICERVTAGMRGNRPAQGLEQAIALAGELLAKHFPPEAGDRNELPDTVVTLG